MSRNTSTNGLSSADYANRRASEVERLREIKRQRPDRRIPGNELMKTAILLDRHLDDIRRLVRKAELADNRAAGVPPDREKPFRMTLGILSIIVAHEWVIEAAYDACRSSGLVSCSKREFREASARVHPATRSMAIKGFGGHRRRVSYTRFSAPHRMVCLQADSHLLGVHVRCPGHKKPQRPWLIVALDDYSRLVLGWGLFAHQPNSYDGAAVIADAIRGYGLPQMVLIDNGPEFMRMLDDLAIDVGFDAHAGRPNEPMRRGKIERFFGAFRRWAILGLPGRAISGRTGKYREQLYSYYNEPDAELLTFDELEARIANRITFYNEERLHRGIGRRTPRSVFDADDAPLSPVGPELLIPYTIPLHHKGGESCCRVVWPEGVQIDPLGRYSKRLDGSEHSLYTNLSADLDWWTGRKVLPRTYLRDPSRAELFDLDGKHILSVFPHHTFDPDDLLQADLRRQGLYQANRTVVKMAKQIQDGAAKSLDKATGEMASLAEFAISADLNFDGIDIPPEVLRSILGHDGI